MALDIWVGEWEKWGSRRITSFDPEAYYWFLYPLFEILESNGGQRIDLYDGARFEAESLNQLRELVDQAVAMVSQQDLDFVVTIGTALETDEEGEPIKVYESVNRGHFLEFLAKWCSAIEKASRKNKPLIFYGD